MVFAAYLLENAILVLSPGGAFAPYFKPHRGAFATFPKKNDKWPGGGMGKLGIDWAITQRVWPVENLNFNILIYFFHFLKQLLQIFEGLGLVKNLTTTQQNNSQLSTVSCWK